MDLKTFVSETLEQIIAGIKAAQETEGGDNVAPQMFGTHESLISGGTSGLFTPVHFDVALTTTTAGEGKGQISVLGAFKAGGGGSHSVGREHRIKFTVPVRLPGSNRNG